MYEVYHKDSIHKGFLADGDGTILFLMVHCIYVTWDALPVQLTYPFAVVLCFVVYPLSSC